MNHLKKADAAMASLIGRTGPCRIAYREPRFDALARSIVFQQLNGRAAATIYERLEKACGAAGVTPQGILKLRLPRMRAAGLSAQKSEYLKDLARRTHAGEIDFDTLPRMADAAVIDTLTQVKGVGVWTAQMFLMFALARPDVLPTADYGIRTAMRNLYGLADLPKPAEMERIAMPWRPWASIACWYLWRSLDGGAEL
ncbi:MAG: DNA-3-methyladenine glycosylase 2 family protein [Bryobacteraceae bacterium]